MTEAATTGWTLTSIQCQVGSANGGSVTTDLATGKTTIALKEGENVSCTYTNTKAAQPALIVIKHVVNDSGGTATAADFTMGVTGTNASPASFAGVESPGTSVGLSAGSYSVSESGPSGYAASYSADCSGSISAGQTKTCTVTNDDIQPTLVVVKHVVNDNGDSASAATFTMSVTATNASPASFAGAESPGTSVALDAGAYSVGETESPDYAASYSAGCSGTIAAGETKICTVTNDDRKASPSIATGQTVVINDSATIAGIRPGGSPAASVVFRLFTDAACTDQVYTETAQVINGAASTTTGYTTTTADTYYWIASYSGDSYNDPRASDCGTETTTIQQ